MLNRNYRVEGEIIKGQGLGGRKLVPTLNLKVYNYTLPKSGVYATLTEIDGVEFKSITFLGHRVSTDGLFAIETHIIGRDMGELHGGVKIEFISFIRNSRKFGSLEELKGQIVEDIKFAKMKMKKMGLE